MAATVWAFLECRPQRSGIALASYPSVWESGSATARAGRSASDVLVQQGGVQGAIAAGPGAVEKGFSDATGREGTGRQRGRSLRGRRRCQLKNEGFKALVEHAPVQPVGYARGEAFHPTTGGDGLPERCAGMPRRRRVAGGCPPDRRVDGEGISSHVARDHGALGRGRGNPRILHQGPRAC